MKKEQQQLDDGEMNVYRLLRIARNKRIKDLAEELGITPAYIHAIENGKKVPSSRLLRDYANALGVKEDTLLSFKPVEQGSDRFEKTLLSLLKMICKVNDIKEE